jgi:hypothetical protein
MPEFAELADGFQPAEDLLNHLPAALALGVADVSGGAGRRAHRRLGRDVRLPHSIDEAARNNSFGVPLPLVTANEVRGNAANE